MADYKGVQDKSNPILSTYSSRYISCCIIKGRISNMADYKGECKTKQSDCETIYIHYLILPRQWAPSNIGVIQIIWETQLIFVGTAKSIYVKALRFWEIIKQGTGLCYILNIHHLPLKKFSILYSWYMLFCTNIIHSNTGSYNIIQPSLWPFWAWTKKLKTNSGICILQHNNSCKMGQGELFIRWKGIKFLLFTHFRITVFTVLHITA